MAQQFWFIQFFSYHFPANEEIRKMKSHKLLLSGGSTAATPASAFIPAITGANSAQGLHVVDHNLHRQPDHGSA